MINRKNNNSPILTILLSVSLLLSLSVTTILVANRSNNRDFQTKATNPCEGLVQRGPLKDISGVVKTKAEDNFMWLSDGNEVEKTVVVCPDTLFKRRYLGGGGDLAPMSYTDLKVGDRASITGWYTNQSETTIWPNLVRVENLSAQIETKGRIVSFAGASSLTMEARNEKGGRYTVTVLISAGTKCELTNGTVIECSQMEVGDNIGGWGIYNSQTKTVENTVKIVDYSKKVRK